MKNLQHLTCPVSRPHVDFCELVPPRKFWSLATIICGFLALVSPPASQASLTVLPGWDLFSTIPGMNQDSTINPNGTFFNGVPFRGVPVGTYDFGGAVGSRPVGQTDTIVQRISVANAPSTTVPLTLNMLQLESQVPVDMGLGVAIYYLTLQSVRGGTPTTGSMTINFGPEGDPHGTFDSFFDVYFDVRLGSVNGQIAFSDHLTLAGSGTPWGHESPTGAQRIAGVNYLLNGTDTSNDFWPGGSLGEPFTERHPGVPLSQHTVGIPEPGTMVLNLLAAGMFVLRRRRGPGLR